METDRRGLYRGPFGPSQPSGGCAFCAGPATVVALPVRTDFQGGNPAETETAFRHENHPGNSFSGRVESWASRCESARSSFLPATITLGIMAGRRMIIR